MKYKSIELVNYAGIYNGMGINQIKIDFTKCISNKIIIRGSNGSGKSTLMGAIHPNPDSNDKFIPGAEARKTLVLYDGITEYVIRYIHPVNNSGRGTTKGYISKIINGQAVELNPNGNISSCKDILYDEFGFDSVYSSLSQLSSEDRGLVDKKPAERKRLVSSITNSMDTFNGIYKSMSKKMSTLKALIGNLTAKIDMVGDETKLRVTANNISSQLEVLEKDKNNTIEAIAAVKLKISSIESILQENKYDDIIEELRSLNICISSYESKINSILKDKNIDDLNIDSLNKLYEYLKLQIIKLENDVSMYKTQISEMMSDREKEYKDLQTKQEKLKSLQGDINYVDLINIMKQTELKLKECESVFNTMGLMNIDLITKDEFESGMETLHTLLHNANVLTSTYDISLIKEEVYNRSNVLNLIDSLVAKRNQLDSLLSRKSQLESEFIKIQSKRELAQELINRPSGCMIDDCVYISAALQADKQFPESLLLSTSEELESINNQISDLQKQIDYINKLSEIHYQVYIIEMNLKSKFISKLPIREDFRETFMDRVVNLDPFKDIDDLYKFVDCGNMIEEYKVLKNQYTVYQNEYKLYESKNTIVESMIIDIENIKRKTDDLARNIESLNASILSNEKSLAELEPLFSKVKELLDKYNSEYIPDKNRAKELESIKQTMENDITELLSLRNNLEVLNNNLITIQNDIRNLNDRLQSINHSLVMLNDYKLELDEYNKDYTLVSKIRYYASPNTGIQSIFIGIFMNKILSNANQLLGLLFDGEFVLEPFIVNESEFRIPAIGAGLRHDDISSMSTAQKSAIALIISFALLNQSSTKYNVICLDEMDGGMDSVNRSNFIILLDRVMNLLNCEQAFIISHNNELDTSLCDIISLKNHPSEIISGNIIWKY